MLNYNPIYTKVMSKSSEMSTSHPREKMHFLLVIHKENLQKEGVFPCCAFPFTETPLLYTIACLINAARAEEFLSSIC